MIELKPITLFELLYLVISLGGLITVIFSLRAVFNQTKIIATTLKASLSDTGDEKMFKINEIFIDKPQLRQYFYDGKSINPTDTDYDTVVSIAFYMLDFFAGVLIQKKEFGGNVPSDWWVNWMT
jgi:hypothetical protein